MVTTIHTLEHYFPMSTCNNLAYLKDIPSIPISLGSQLDCDRTCITQWKQYRNRIIEDMKPYIIDTFQIVHKHPFYHFCAWLKDNWAFELGFLRNHHESSPTAYHPMACPICHPHVQTTFP